MSFVKVIFVIALFAGVVAAQPVQKDSSRKADGRSGAGSIFNGRDLTGWEGDPKYWSVQDGAITGMTDGKMTYNRFLIWRGGVLGNFELRVKVRMMGGNSGIQYRSIQLKDIGDFVMSGYQCDLVSDRPDYHGMLYEERGRGLLAHVGEKTIVDPDGSKLVVGKFPEPPPLKPEEWHELRIIVRGNHHIHRLNGRTTVDVVDYQESKRALEGLLGLQVHTGPPMKVQFRDFRLRVLQDAPILKFDARRVPDKAEKVAPPGPPKKSVK